MQPTDTTSDAYRTQVDIWRRLGGSETLAMAMRLSEQARRLTEEGIRARHPDYSEIEVKHALFRLVLGDVLYSTVWPTHAPVEP